MDTILLNPHAQIGNERQVAISLTLYLLVAFDLRQVPHFLSLCRGELGRGQTRMQYIRQRVV